MTTTMMMMMMMMMRMMMNAIKMRGTKSLTSNCVGCMCFPLQPTALLYFEPRRRYSTRNF